MESKDKFGFKSSGKSSADIIAESKKRMKELEE